MDVQNDEGPREMIHLEMVNGKVEIKLEGEIGDLIFLCMIALIENEKLRIIFSRALDDVVKIAEAADRMIAEYSN